MIQSIALLVLGFVVLIFGASTLVTGATSLAARLKVSDLVIGLTVVAFGTSLPELTVNTFNSVKGLNDAIFGNVIGSNIFNILLILGVTGLIFPISVDKRTVAYEVPFSIVITIVLFFLINDHFYSTTSNSLGFGDSLVILCCFAIFLFYIFKSLKGISKEESTDKKLRPVYQSALFIVLGLGAMIAGGYLITENAVNMANYFGMSEKLISLTILSIGTSLPELATSTVAAYKRNASIAVGNVIGSNIFNISFILGINGIIHPVSYSPIMNYDIYFLLFGSLVLMIAMFTGGKRKLDRWEAFLLLITYIGYIIYIIIRN